MTSKERFIQTLDSIYAITLDGIDYTKSIEQTNYTRIEQLRYNILLKKVKKLTNLVTKMEELPELDTHHN